MLRHRRHAQHAETAAMLAAIASETRPYTDPRAGYALAQTARDAQVEGQNRRAPDDAQEA